MLEFIFDYRNRKKVAQLEQQVIELEKVIVATIKLAEIHTQTLLSLTTEVVKISNIINSEIEKHNVSIKNNSNNYLN